MNLLSMNPKLGILATIVTGSILAATFHSIALASPAEHYDRQQMNQGKMQEYMKIRLAKLAERLKIKSSQQAVWEEFSKSVEMLADRNEKNQTLMQMQRQFPATAQTGQLNLPINYPGWPMQPLNYKLHYHQTNEKSLIKLRNDSCVTNRVLVIITADHIVMKMRMARTGTVHRKE